MGRGSAFAQVLSSRPADPGGGQGRQHERPLGPGCSQFERNLHAHAGLVAAVRERRVPECLLAPSFRMEHHTAAATDYTYLGPRGWREWMSDLFECFAEGATYDTDEPSTAREDFVVATFHVTGVSVWSRNPLQLSWVGVTWFRNGQATRAVGVASRAHAEALAACATRA